MKINVNAPSNMYLKAKLPMKSSVVSRRIIWPKMRKICDNSNNNKVYPLSVVRLQAFIAEEKGNSSYSGYSSPLFSSQSLNENQSIIDYSRNNSSNKLLSIQLNNVLN